MENRFSNISLGVPENKMIKNSLKQTKEILQGLIEDIIPNLENLHKIASLRESIEIIEEKLKSL